MSENRRPLGGGFFWLTLYYEKLTLTQNFQRFKRLPHTCLFSYWNRGVSWLTVEAVPHKFSYLHQLQWLETSDVQLSMVLVYLVVCLHIRYSSMTANRMAWYAVIMSLQWCMSVHSPTDSCISVVNFLWMRSSSSCNLCW